MLGEVWYSEADRHEGPWVHARKIITLANKPGDAHSFYSPNFLGRGGLSPVVRAEEIGEESPMSPSRNDESKVSILLFVIDGLRYGLLASDVRELFRTVTIVSPLSAPSTLEGVINVRGVIVPVLNLRARLGLPPRPLEVTDHLILVESGGARAAIRVDRALELVRVDVPEIERVGDASGSGGDARAIAVVKLPDGTVPLLEASALMSGEVPISTDPSAPNRWDPSPARQERPS